MKLKGRFPTPLSLHLAASLFTSLPLLSITEILVTLLPSIHDGQLGYVEKRVMA
jgi:hypothetical protein